MITSTTTASSTSIEALLVPAFDHDNRVGFGAVERSTRPLDYVARFRRGAEALAGGARGSRMPRHPQPALLPLNLRTLRVPTREMLSRRLDELAVSGEVRALALQRRPAAWKSEGQISSRRPDELARSVESEPRHCGDDLRRRSSRARYRPNVWTNWRERGSPSPGIAVTTRGEEVRAPDVWTNSR